MKIGPHEGQELELMLSGRKPLSMFVEDLEAEDQFFPEADFDELVSCGRLKRALLSHQFPCQTASPRRSGALPEEEWRIKALLLVLDIYDWSGPSWRPDLERAIGALLGYERSDIEHFIELLPQRAS